MVKVCLILWCSLLSFFAFAVDEVPAQVQSEQRPLVQVDVNFEMAAINESLKVSSESIAEISGSFRIMAESGQLNEEQKEHLVSVIDNLNHLVETTRLSVDALPSLVNRSRDTLSAQGTEFFSDLKFWTITILVVLGVVLIIAIICFYYFVLRPLQETALEVTSNMSDMAKAMENTSKTLEISNDTQRELIKLTGYKENSG